MKQRFFLLSTVFVFAFAWLIAGPAAYAAEPIVIGVPTSLGFLEGKESHKAVQMAVSEINAMGGVMVGGEKRLFKVVATDLRDAAAGVPVPEALLGIEKLILEQKPTAILVGPFRSEALLAGMDIFAKYKMPMLGTIAMSPGSEAKIKKDPEKYKYVFRVSLNVIYWVKLLAGTNATLKQDFGFDKVYIMNQDVAWARGTAGGMEKKVYPSLKMEVVGHDQFPTGFSDYSSALMKAKAKGAGVLFTCFDMPESGVAPARNFYNNYKKTYGNGIQSGHGPAPSYESVYILKEAIERAGSLDPDAIVAEIEKTDRKGVMGRIRFDEGHQVVYGIDPAETAVGAFFQWTEKGKRKIVYPKSLAEGEIVLPPWVKKR
ncbi:MAG: ABC transporter substrate-binding protein [Desulfobacterales bacterium]